MSYSILVVDDNADDMLLTKRVLLKTGFSLDIQEALSGEQALELLKKDELPPSLIFIDLKMPGMSGVETLREIRHDARLKHVPVVVLTNSTLESDKREAEKMGANAYLQKGFDIHQFGCDLRFLLDRWLVTAKRDA